MATQQEIKNNIVKDIASEFFNKIPFYYVENGVTKQINSVSDIRKIISGGGVSTVSGSLVDENQQLVLYQQDY